MALTKRQKQVLDFIGNFVDENGYCPSYEEIARGLELASLATVHKHISVLEAKSYLKRGFNQSRSLELTPKYVQEQRRTRPVMAEIPMLGRSEVSMDWPPREMRTSGPSADSAAAISLPASAVVTWVEGLSQVTRAKAMVPSRLICAEFAAA